MKFKGLLSPVICILLIAGIYGCGSAPSLENANKEFNLYRFNAAADMYKKISKKEKNKRKKREAIFRIAECYRWMNSYSRAETFYAKAISMKYPDPIAIYYHADMMRRQENYEKALIEFNKYIKEAPSDPKGKEGVESCQNAIKWKTEHTRYVVENVKILNTKWNDFSPTFYKNGSLIFTSDREGSTGGIYDWTGVFHTDLWVSELQKGNKTGKLDKPVLLEKDGVINTRFNDGTSCFDKKMNTMYFTQCNGSKGKEPNCKIYKASKKGQTWDEPEMLPFCSDTAANYGQPSLSPDGKKLYFCSTMRGGYGGHDIWVSTLVSKGKTWSDPQNLGPVINTTGEEMYPYIYSDNKTLYFSSDQHGSIGGLDIFYSVKDDTGGWTKPLNMKMPINSSGDDFAIIVEPNGSKTKGFKGYFSSDRYGSRGDDVYKFWMTPLKFNLAGTVFNQKTKGIIPGATVSLVVNDTMTLTTISDKAGYYKFKLDPDSRYKVSATMKFFFNSREDSVSTVGLENSQDFVRDLYLDPYVNTEFTLEGIFYELDSTRLLPASIVILDSLYKVLVRNPYLVIEIGSHTDCRASYDYNIDLSNRRAQRVVDYLVYKGIPVDRLSPHGYGETQLVNNCKCESNEGPGMNCTEAEHQMNRRTTFKVLRNDYGLEQDKNQSPNKNQNNQKNNKNISKPVIPNQNNQQDQQNINQDNQNNGSDTTQVKKVKPVRKPPLKPGQKPPKKTN